MIDRIKRLREALNISQNKFAKSLGLTSSYFSKVESRKSNLSDHTVKLICLMYNVNENWLRNGVGEMFEYVEPTPNLSERKKRLLKSFDKMTEEDKNFLLKIALKLEPVDKTTDEQTDN